MGSLDDLEGNSQNAGCLGQFFWIPLLRFGIKHSRKVAGEFYESQETIKLRNRAKALLAIDRIPMLLCPLIARESNRGVMEREIDLILIRILTESLTLSDVAAEHKIPRNPQLFALMAWHIVEIGPTAYCASKDA